MHACKACSVVMEHMHIAGQSRVNLVESAAPPKESELQQNKNEL